MSTKPRAVPGDRIDGFVNVNVILCGSALDNTASRDSREQRAIAGMRACALPSAESTSTCSYAAHRGAARTLIGAAGAGHGAARCRDLPPDPPWAPTPPASVPTGWSTDGPATDV